MMVDIRNFFCYDRKQPLTQEVYDENSLRIYRSPAKKFSLEV